MKQKQTKPDYSILHKETIDILRSVGIHYPYDYRLDLFWLRTRLPKLVDNTSILKDLSRNIDLLVKLRTRGLEPYNKSGKYIDE